MPHGGRWLHNCLGSADEAKTSMKWDRGYRSSDVEDRRGSMGLGGGLFGPIVAIGSRFGIIGIVIAIGLYFGARAFLGGDSPLSATSNPGEGRPAAGSKADELASFVSFVFDDTQKVWTEKLADRGRRYQRTQLVLFTNTTPTSCGYGSAAVGPFYCPTDRRVYIDLGFYRDLARRLGAPGDFAQAYVIAHEVGHHVQTLLGMHTPDGSVRRESRSAESVKFELQADCFAGVWANSTQQRDLLEHGDIEEALGATAAIGDDRLQRQSTGTVHPETFTHGTSEQRGYWFRRGLRSGDMDTCDTSSEAHL
jgi:predicted metalloprotease